MQMITNRDLARISEKSLVQIKRDSVLALGVDPLTGSSSGKAREYSLNDAFLVYLFTRCLVSNQRLDREDAKKFFDLIRKAFEAENLHYETFILDEHKVIYSDPEIEKKLDDFKNKNGDIWLEPPDIKINGYIGEVEIERTFPFRVINKIADKKRYHERIKYVVSNRYLADSFKVVMQDSSIFSIDLIREYYRFKERL